ISCYYGGDNSYRGGDNSSELSRSCLVPCRGLRPSSWRTSGRLAPPVGPFAFNLAQSHSSPVAPYRAAGTNPVDFACIFSVAEDEKHVPRVRLGHRKIGSALGCCGLRIRPGGERRATIDLS